MCGDHDHIAVFYNDEMIFNSDYPASEVLPLLAEHLGWELETETIDSEEYSERYG